MSKSTFPTALRLSFLGVCLLLLLTVVACAPTPSLPTDIETGKPQPSAATTPGAMVWSIAGIRPGAMNDSDVVSMYGPGSPYGYLDQPLDRRYYTDPSHKVTLLVGTHTDNMVVVVKLTEGTLLPSGVDSALTVSSLSVPVHIDQGIALGMTPGEVEGLLGQPVFDQSCGTVRTFIYEVTADDPAAAGYVSYSATYEFENDQLRSVEVYAGE